MVGWKYMKHCKKCGDIKEAYGKRSKICKDCFDNNRNSFLRKKYVIGDLNGRSV